MQTHYILYFIALIFLNSSQALSQVNKVEFGIQFFDTISLPNEQCYITDIKIMEYDRKNSKKLYHNDTLNIRPVDSMNVLVLKKHKNKHYLQIPPLEPDRIYKLKVKYIGNDNIYGLVLTIAAEKLDNNTIVNSEQVKMILNHINYFDTTAKKLYYFPGTNNLKFIKEKLKNVKFNKLSSKDSTELLNLYKDYIPILFYKGINTNFDSLVSFAKYLKNIDNNKLSVDAQFKFLESFGKIPDYNHMIEFSNGYIMSFISNREIASGVSLIREINKLLNIYKSRFADDEILPNFLDSVYMNNYATNVLENYISTFSKDFATSYQRKLIPDFGYAAFTKFNNGISGGSPFIGVHIALKSVNKNAPFRLSNMGFWGKSSLHLGICLNKFNKAGYYKDFVDDFSVLLGVGYKIFSHATRINMGTMMFRKEDPFNAKYSLAFQPYLGASIDLEIRKWLTGISSTITGIFKDRD